jgi:hypothetical protein
MSDQPKEMKIEVVGEFAKPSDKLVTGDKRLVRWLPCGLPGTKGMLLPSLWISPYERFDEDERQNMKFCILLLSKGPPKPETAGVWIPSDAIEKFPLGPVEW